MNIPNNQFHSIAQVQEQYLNNSKKTQRVPDKPSTGLTFQDVLAQKSAEQVRAADSAGSIKFSKHAANRLQDRNIELTDNQLERLQEGTRKANEKGINESLVIVDQLAFIVNIPNKTVVTAMDQTDTQDNIYTNIDGAVIM
ncbi:MAG: TIGR02530 family flagellar biosynthesis protein [Lachnospiraceae bacterium]